MVLCLSVFHCSVYGVVFICVSLLSVLCCVYLCFTAQCMVCLCFTAQCMVLCLCFIIQCMVLCWSAFHCSMYGAVFVCFLFLYDSLVQDVETRASLVKERLSF